MSHFLPNLFCRGFMRIKLGMERILNVVPGSLEEGWDKDTYFSCPGSFGLWNWWFLHSRQMLVCYFIGWKKLQSASPEVFRYMPDMRECLQGSSWKLRFFVTFAYNYWVLAEPTRTTARSSTSWKLGLEHSECCLKRMFRWMLVITHLHFDDHNSVRCLIHQPPPVIVTPQELNMLF